MNNRHFISITFLFFIGIFFGSCNNDVEKVEDVKTGVIKYTYKGNSYETSYSIIGDSIAYEDISVYNFYQELLDNGVGSILKEDGSFEVYDEIIFEEPSEDDKASISRLSTSSPQISDFTFQLFKSPYLSGVKIHETHYVKEADCNAGFGMKSLKYNNLYFGNNNFHKAVQSFSITMQARTSTNWDPAYNAYFIFFDNQNCTGAYLMCQGDPDSWMGAVYDFGPSWNNRIQSMNLLVSKYPPIIF